MWRRSGVQMSVIFYWLTIIQLATSTSSIKDFGHDSTVIETDSLPTLADGETIDTSQMPYVGNGHIATTIYNESMHMNGIYTGERSRSHRARIPVDINFRVHFKNEQRKQVYRQYRLDVKKSFWEEKVIAEECRVTHRIYAHQYYTRLLVAEVFAQRQGAITGNLMIFLNRSTASTDSKDFRFSDTLSFNGGNWYTYGTTANSEIRGGHRSKIFKYWSIVPPIIHIPSYQNSIRYTYMMSVDTTDEVAKESFKTGSWMADKNPDHFFSLHLEAWQKKWAEGSIELSGEDKSLEKLAYSSLYYILSSLPSIDSHRESNDFGGISSTSLANGGGNNPNDLGHVSWDQERWLLPAVLPFYPALAKAMLSYRVNTMTAAYSQALTSGYRGLLYSWQSAATGIEVSPSSTSRNHLHINGDISFAARQFVAMTADKLWLQEEGGCDLIKDIGHFWFSKAEYNSDTQRYDISDVTPPDETLKSVDNSVYTNAVASLSLHYAKYAACLCNTDVNDYAPYEWILAAQYLHWEYNNSKNFNPEFHDFVSSNNGRLLLQPSAVLLNFPLMWSLPASTVKRNLELYSSILSPDSPATARSMLTIGWLQLDEIERAKQTFYQSYEPYVQGPFKVWSEYPNDGMVNYLSGMGAYIQSLVYGYGGLRIHVDHMILDPKLPPKVHSMTLKNIDYMGSKFDLKVTSVLMHIEVESIGVEPLLLIASEDGRQYYLTRGASIPVQRGLITIKPAGDDECPVPDDNILPSGLSKSKYRSMGRSSAPSIQTISHTRWLTTGWLLVLLLLQLNDIINHM